MTAYDAACSVIRVLREAGHQALLAGGCVRDMLIGREPVDYDVATSARPDDVIALFDRTIPLGVQFGVVIVVMHGSSMEVATFRRDDGYEDGRHPRAVTFTDARGDAERRDFTVNAMFYDVDRGEVVDYVGGREDLERKLIRAVGDPLARFREDRLRMLRAIRFAVTLGFALDSPTLDAIREEAAEIAVVSAERLAAELERMLVHPRRADAVRLMDDAGLLAPILPEVAAMKGVPQSPVYHPEGEVFTHVLGALDHLDNPSWPLALATLLHDIGKPVVKDELPGHFYRHDTIGAEMARAVCRRLKLPNEVTNRVAWLVKRHMHLWQACQMRLATLKRLYAEPGYPELVALHRADALAAGGQLDALEYAERVRSGLRQEDIAPPPVLRGADLIEMGLEPGPVFGKILAEIAEEQLQGTISTREEALEHVLRRAGELGLNLQN